MLDLKTLLEIDPENQAGVRLTHEMRARHGLDKAGREEGGSERRLRDMKPETIKDLVDRGLISIYEKDPDYVEMIIGQKPGDFKHPDDIRPWEELASGSAAAVAEGFEPPVRSGQVAPRNFTARQLQEFDGKDYHQPIYISLRHEVYDVTTGRGFYGKNQAYNLFAGHDASKSLALMSFNLKDIDSDYESLEADSQKSLDGWIEQFDHKYVRSGRLITDMPEQRDLTEEELLEYDGTNPVPEGFACPPIYVGLKGRIFDVSFGGSHLFGPGGPYSMLAGRDATMALAKMELDPAVAFDGTEEGSLTAEEAARLKTWVRRFRFYKRYPIVGKLIQV
ncbi:unnamed protein product [Chrysoparadoxa australica]